MLVSRLSACSLFGFEALLCVAWDGADAIGRYNVLWGSCLRAPQFPRPLLLHFRGIEARFISQSLTLLLVGRAGWLHLQRRQNHLPAPPARTAPLRSSPSSALPEDSSHGSRERQNSFDLSKFFQYVLKQRKQDTQANKGSPPLSEEVPYQITLIRLSQGSLDRRRREKVIWEMFTENYCNTLHVCGLGR